MVVETATLPFIALLIISFFAGILCFFSPCSLPVLPTYFAYTFKAQKNILKHTLLFSLGVVLFFALLGMTATVAGSLLKAYSYLLGRIAGVLLIGFGMIVMLDWHPPLSQLKKTPLSSSYTGSFLLGLMYSLAWSPCIGPILAGIFIIAAATATTYLGGLLLVFYAVGLVLPLIVLSLFFDGAVQKKNVVWKFLEGRQVSLNFFRRTYTLHTTHLVSGVLFILVGIVMALGYVSVIGQYVATTTFQKKIFAAEEWLAGLF